MQQIILVFHVLIAISLIGLVLVQQGKGAEAGVAFGGGASQTVFGSQGSSSFLFKLTAGLAFAFFITSMGLTRMAANPSAVVQPNSILQVPAETQSTIPVAPTDLIGGDKVPKSP